MGVILSIVVVLFFFLWDRGHATGFPVCRMKDILIWEKGFVFVFLEKMIRTERKIEKEKGVPDSTWL